MITKVSMSAQHSSMHPYNQYYIQQIDRCIFSVFVLEEKPSRLTDTCVGPADKRKDCGYRNKTDMENHLKNDGFEKYWIPKNSEECAERGCCFDDSIPDVNWCFKKGNKRGN